MRGRPKQKQYIVDAIATYICVAATRLNKMTIEVDVSHIKELFDANETDIEKAYYKAHKFLRDFI